jgi:translocation and assembly module TamB
MRRLRFILLGLLAFILVILSAGWLLLHTKVLWTWSGHQLVAFAQDRLYPELTVKEVRGHPFTGITFEGITLTSPQGEVITAKRLDFRFSLWSFVKLEPVIGRLAIYEPKINLWRHPDGSLNLSHILRKRPPPPFRSLDFPEILVEGGEVTFREGGQISRYPRFDFRCTLLVLHPKRPEQAVFVRRAMLSADTAHGRFSIRTRLAYHRQELNLLTLEVYEEFQPIALLGGKAQFSEEPSVLLSGEFKSFSGGTIRGFLPWWPTPWNIAGKFSLEASRADVKVSTAGQLNGTPFLFKGRLEKEADWRYELDLGMAGLNPELVAPLSAPLAEKLKGITPFSTRLQATGSGLSWPPASCEWRLTASPFKYHQADVQHLEITLSGGGGEQTLKSLIIGNFGRLAVDAQGPLLSHTQGRVKATAVNLQPRLLGLEVPSETLLNGTFAGSVALPDSLALDRVKAAGELKASGRLGSFSPLEWQSSIAWEQPNLQISQASLRVGDLTAELKGALKGESLDFQGQGKLPPEGALPWPAPLSGQLSVAFTARGSWRAPDLTLEAQGQNLSWRGYRVRSARLKAAAQGWFPSAGHLDLQAAGIRTGSWVVSQALVTCQGSENRWRFHLKAPSSSGPKAELLGLVDLSQRPLLLKLEQAHFKFGNIAIRNAAQVTMSFLPGLRVEPATFMINEGKVTLAGRLQESEVTGRLEVQEVPAEIFHLPGFDLKGLLRGQVTLAGSPKSPIIQGQLRSGPVQVSEFAFNTLEASLNYQDSLFTFTGVLAEKAAGGPRLRWDGKLPLRFSFQPFQWTWGDTDFHVLVKGENTHLAMLTAFTEELQEAEGSMDLTAEWRGTISRPQLTGHIRWGPGSIRLRQAGMPYRLHPGMIRLQGDTLTIPELVLESQGTARLSGKVTLEGFSPERVEARAALNDFKALSRSGSEAFASGTATLSGPWQGALLKGNIVLNQGSFRTTFFQTGEHDDIVLVREAKSQKPHNVKEVKGRKPAFYRNLTMDVQLASPEGVWVRNKRLMVKLAGSLKLKKTPADDELFAKGLLQIKEGAVDVQGREFKVTRGEVHLPGTPGAAVTATMRAVSKVSDITLVLDIHGPVNRPEVELTSIPPLPPADVLAYLVFSRPAQALTQQQFRSMGEQAVGILGGFTAKKLRDFLGKDFPLVGDVYVQGGKESVGVAKPLTKDITVSFERKTEPLARDDTNQVRMDYRLNRYFKVESQFGRRNSGADVLFNVDF